MWQVHKEGKIFFIPCFLLQSTDVAIYTLALSKSLFFILHCVCVCALVFVLYRMHIEIYNWNYLKRRIRSTLMVAYQELVLITTVMKCTFYQVLIPILCWLSLRDLERLSCHGEMKRFGNQNHILYSNF